jgi:uncharacterized protein YceH (UPF0502 family)
VLSPFERRVLGVLVEKAKTTPDVYPLSISALVTGCNQKSNRDPVMNLSEEDVEDALTRAQQKGLAIKITGGRVLRWRHALYEAWHVDKGDLAVLAELLLRGPQTEGELRSRASRMEELGDLEALRAVLRPLAQRRLIVYLSPEGQRGTMLTHGFHDAAELERLHDRRAATSEMGEAPPSAISRPAAGGALSVLEARLADTMAEVAHLRNLVTDLQAAVAALSNQVRDFENARANTSP